MGKEMRYSELIRISKQDRIDSLLKAQNYEVLSQREGKRSLGNFFFTKRNHSSIPIYVLPYSI